MTAGTGWPRVEAVVRSVFRVADAPAGAPGAPPGDGPTGRPSGHPVHRRAGTRSLHGPPSSSRPRWTPATCGVARAAAAAAGHLLHRHRDGHRGRGASGPWARPTATLAGPAQDGDPGPAALRPWSPTRPEDRAVARRPTADRCPSVPRRGAGARIGCSDHVADPGTCGGPRPGRRGRRGGRSPTRNRGIGARRGHGDGAGVDVGAGRDSVPPAGLAGGPRGLRAPTWPSPVLTWSRVWFTGHPTSTVTCGCGDPGRGAVVPPVVRLRRGPRAGRPTFTPTSMFTPQGFERARLHELSATGGRPHPGDVAVRPGGVVQRGGDPGPGGCRGAAPTSPAARWIGWRPAAVVCGLLFGFGPMITDNAPYGHLMSWCCASRRSWCSCSTTSSSRHSGDWRRSGALLGLVVVGQFFTGTEMLVICVVLGASGAVFLMVANPGRIRARAPYALRGLGRGRPGSRPSCWPTRCGSPCSARTTSTGCSWPYIDSGGSSTLPPLQSRPGAPTPGRPSPR